CAKAVLVKTRADAPAPAAEDVAGRSAAGAAPPPHPLRTLTIEMAMPKPTAQCIVRRIALPPFGSRQRPAAGPEPRAGAVLPGQSPSSAFPGEAGTDASLLLAACPPALPPPRWDAERASSSWLLLLLRYLNRLDRRPRPGGGP